MNVLRIDVDSGAKKSQVALWSWEDKKVESRGFEPLTSCMQNMRANQLFHDPSFNRLFDRIFPM